MYSRPHGYPAAPAPTPAPVSAHANRVIVGALFFLVMMLSIAAMAWNVGGAPVRGVAAVGALVFLAAINRAAVTTAFERHRGLLLLILGVAMLGAVVSLLNGLPAGTLLRELLEIHIQSAVFLLLGAVVAEICGAGTFALLLAAAVGISASFAAAQFLGVEAAWSIRDAIAHFSHEAVRYEKARAPGLALTGVVLATHLCVALAAVLVWLQRLNEAEGAPRRFDWRALLAVALFSIGCLVSGNRSPILGAAVFMAVYSVVRAPRTFLFVAPLLLMAIPMAGAIFDAMQGTGMRAFMTGDKSSEGRVTLIFYGLQLFREHPLGYGLGFDPTRYWGDHLELLMTFTNPNSAISFELHNYPLTILNYYGVGILLAIPAAFAMMARHRSVLLAFLPYVIHILFHNYGPLAKNDHLIFLAFAAVAMPVAPALSHATRRAGDVGRVAWRRGPVAYPLYASRGAAAMNGPRDQRL
jgi:hypothetical protein